MQAHLHQHPAGLACQGSSRLVCVLALVLLLAASAGRSFTAGPVAPSEASLQQAQALGNTGGSAPSRFFSATGKAVKGAFLSTFDRFGLERIGYPLSDERSEQGRVVQYFERVRMEYHPELASKGYSVLMTRLGVDFTGAQFDDAAPFKSTTAKAYFAETGHSLVEPFLSYWRSKGGVELYGYPISEPLKQDGLTVQWFERARFEYHPELAAKGKAVQLTHLGKLALDRTAPPAAPAAAQPAVPVANQKTAAPEAQLSDMERYLFGAVNEQRGAAGLKPVEIDASVSELSHARSSDMAERNYFSHTTPDGKKFLDMLAAQGIKYSYAGEILARNNYPAGDAGRVAVDSYLKSAPHKAVMLDGRYTTVGVGYALSAEDGMHYFTVIFIER